MDCHEREQVVAGKKKPFKKCQKMTDVSIKRSSSSWVGRLEARMESSRMGDNLVVVWLQCDKLELCDGVVVHSGEKEATVTPVCQ